MEYYRSGNLLFSHNDETQTYVLKNNIRVHKILFKKDEIAKMPMETLQQEKFLELLNEYFRTTRDTWSRDGVKFRTMEYFELNKANEMINYKWNKIPTYVLEVNGTQVRAKSVYYQGRLYYFEWTPGEVRGRLYDAVTHLPVKLTRPRNVCPVLNKTLNRID